MRWEIDPIHKTISFTALHMMVAKVRGQLQEATKEGASAFVHAETEKRPASARPSVGRFSHP